MDFKGVLSEELEDAPERLLRSLPRPFNPRATHDQPPGILAYTDSCLLWISFEGVARACQGVAIEGVSPTPPCQSASAGCGGPRWRRRRQRRRRPSRSVSLLRPRAWEAGWPGRPHRGRGPGREGWAGAAERGGRAGQQGGSCPQAEMLAKAGLDPGQRLRAGEGSCPSAGVTQVMACGACAWMFLSVARNQADKNNVSWGREAARYQPSRRQLLPGVDRGQVLFLPCRRPRSPRPLWFLGVSDTSIKLKCITKYSLVFVVSLE